MKRLCDKILVITMCALFVFIGTAFFALPKRTFSPSENRNLASFPKLGVSNVLSGAFMSDFGSWYADTFPARDAFIASKAYMELAQLKLENNGVIKCGNRLIAVPAENDYDALENNMAAISDFSSDTGALTTVCALPRSADVCAALLPAVYPSQKDENLWESFFALSQKYLLDICDVRGVLSPDDYYKTDHHYTSGGAYRVYTALGEALGYTPYSEDSFDITEVSDSFCGTSMRTSGFYLSEKDKIYLYRYDEDTEYTVMCDGETGSLYDFSALELTDKYAVFLGGNHARVDIDGGTDRQRLLIIRDSFADSLIPFLARHYNITMIDLRYYRESVRELFSDGSYSCVLVFESITELEQNSGLGYLYK